MQIEVTQSQIDRTCQMFQQFAGYDEEILVEFIKGTFYVFGSELATLRLLKKYRDSKNCRQNYSENQGSFYFSLETSL